MKAVKKIVLAAAVVPMVFASASALAFGGKGEHKGGHCQGGMDRGIMKQLDLTDAQKDQLKEMREANKAQMKENYQVNFEARKAERQAHHEKVQQLVLADNFDQAAANDLAKQMVEQQTDRKVKMLEKQHQMLSVLTPEQKAKFVELSKERIEKCGEMRKHRN